MKIHVLLFLLFVYGNKPAMAQDSALLKHRIYRVTAYSPDKIKTNGWLINITDSAVQLADRPVSFATTAAYPVNITTLNYSLLADVTIKRKNGGARGFLIGLATGFGVGALIGIASGDDTEGFFRFSAGEKALAGGVLLGAVSGLAGAIAGAVSRKHFNLQGKKENFHRMQLRVFEMVSQKK